MAAFCLCMTGLVSSCGLILNSILDNGDWKISDSDLYRRRLLPALAFHASSKRGRAPSWSSTLSSSKSTVWADLRRLLEDGGMDFAVSRLLEREGGVEGGTKVWNEGMSAECRPVVLSVLLKVQQLPLILLRLPMEFRMTVALLMDSLEMSRLGSCLQSRLVRIRLLILDEKEFAFGTVMASKSCGLTLTFWKRK